MKTLLLFPFILIAGCASSPAIQPAQSPNPDAPSLAVDYTIPPHTVEQTWQAPPTKALADETPSPIVEADKYNKSITNISSDIANEYFQYNPMCVDNEGEKSKHCYDLLVSLCAIDELIDARGGHHQKFFCTPKFLKYHHP